MNRNHENRIRKLAQRRGYRVTKSRQQEHVDNQGEYMLVELDGNMCVLGRRYDASLDEIEKYLRKQS